MLPARRNKLTVSILEKLREKGPPTNSMVPSFSPLGGEEQGQEEADQQAEEVAGDETDQSQMNPLTRRRKRGSIPVY